MTAGTTPLVTVVMATYNRSACLRHAVQSVVNQTLADWELLVVSDGGTDDSEAVVASFQDPRIRWIHLPDGPSGSQAMPNNRGLFEARGRYVAYLNHDDLYFPDHLARSVEALEGTGADLAYVHFAQVRPDGRVAVAGRPGGGPHDPRRIVPASTWMFRTDLRERVGAWKRNEECWESPIGEWLWRTWRSGARIVELPVLSVLSLPGGMRPDAYRTNRGDEQARLLAMLADPAAARRTIAETERATISRFRRWRGVVVSQWRWFLGTVALWLGISPSAFRHMLRYGTKGRYMASLQRRRGIKVRPAPA